MRRLTPALVAAATLMAVAGCGGGDDGAADKPEGGELPPNVTVRTASCSFWNRATAAQKRVLVADLGRFYDAPNQIDQPGARGPQLETQAATAVLDRSCEPTYAANFKLYKLYGRAAGFTTPN